MISLKNYSTLINQPLLEWCGFKAPSIRTIGRCSELYARQYLCEQGFFIWDFNWRCGAGEIDVVARKKRTLHIIEIKSRRDSTYFQALDNITPEKLSRVQRLKNIYLQKHFARLRRERVWHSQIDILTVDNFSFRPWGQYSGAITLYDNIESYPDYS